MNQNGSIQMPRNAPETRLEGQVISLILASAILAMAPIASAQSLDAVGTERGARIAVDRTYSFSPEEGVVQTILYEAPAHPTRAVRYTAISARFDCRERRRIVLSRTVFSEIRDPQTVDIAEDDPRRSISGPVLDQQMDAVCATDRRQGRLSVSEFVDGAIDAPAPSPDRRH